MMRATQAIETLRAVCDTHARAVNSGLPANGTEETRRKCRHERTMVMVNAFEALTGHRPSEEETRMLSDLRLGR